jgi:membrane protein required for beta-lactamase induction
MSAFRWLVFALGIPITALLLAFVYRFTNPALEELRDLSSSPESAQGIQWYSQFLDFLPLVVLGLLSFAVIVAVITRRERVGGVR